jgi:hypothetical protein
LAAIHSTSSPSCFSNTMISPLILLSLLPSLLAYPQPKPLAGNENYAQNARRSLHALRPRSSSAPSFGPESVTFNIGDKSYLSPVGEDFKSYKLASEWGLEAYEGKTMLVSVVNVVGEVTCDTLGKKVAEYGSVDDVWDQVSGSSLSLTRCFTVPHASRRCTNLRASCKVSSSPLEALSTLLRMSLPV